MSRFALILRWIGPVVVLLSIGALWGLYANKDYTKIFAGIAVLGAALTYLLQWLSDCLEAHRATRVKQRMLGTVLALETLVNDFRDESSGIDRPRRLQGIVKGHILKALDLLSSSILPDRLTPTSLMVPYDDQLRIAYRRPSHGPIDPRFHIELVEIEPRRLEPVNGKGTAGFAYGRLWTVYIPNVALQTGEMINAAPEGLISRADIRGDDTTAILLRRIWKKSARSPEPKSLISVPVMAAATDTDDYDAWGALSIESYYKDAFCSEDFYMLWIGSDCIAEIFRCYQSRISALARGS
ncbi:hypothetical protein KAX17_01825 [Candidatus Bipolaricaulota bacterium]|nr:hypothetical protein [Candidatus Bipolaricaulota bacterium]